MKRIALLILVLAACGGDSGATTTTAAPATTTTTSATDTTAGSDTTVASTTTAAPVGDGTLGLYSVMFTAATVVLFNGTASDADLTGYALCQGGTCAAFPPGTLPAGQYLSIDVGSEFFFPIPGSLSFDEVLDIGGLDATGGEVALLDSGASVVSYVVWGAVPAEGYFDLAVSAGVWAADHLVDTTASTTAITYFPGVSTSDETGWSAF